MDLLGLPHPEMKKCSVQVNSLENEADRVSRDAISALFEKETDPIAVIMWKEVYENFEAGTDRCEDAANILERTDLIMRRIAALLPERQQGVYGSRPPG